MKDRCLHQNIKIVDVSRYIVKEGWDWLQEEEDLDISDYLIEYNKSKIVCEDCAEVLDE